MKDRKIKLIFRGPAFHQFLNFLTPESRKYFATQGNIVTSRYENLKENVMTVVNNLGKIDSLVLANYILETVGKMSHLKLQKLLYLVQGYHLAYFGKPLIDDKFEAWVHGPVSRKVFGSLKDKSLLYADICYRYTSV